MFTMQMETQIKMVSTIEIQCTMTEYEDQKGKQRGNRIGSISKEEMEN